ncbi:MAG: hypothetical protein HYZ75_16655 [Elusimicrobia bacterium]|nr:hypothetical protein [Elusimicrobiota bacterium]
MRLADRLPLLLGTLFLSLLPSAAAACAVCFGVNDNKDVVKAFYIGGVILLVCTFSLVGALIYAIVRLEKARQVQDRKLGLLGDAP